MQHRIGFVMDLEFPGDWSPENHAAIQLLRDYFWPPGAEDGFEAVCRRAHLARDTGLGPAVNVLPELDDQLLFAAMAFLGTPSAFLRAMGASIVQDAAGQADTMAEIAQHHMATIPVAEFVEEVQEYYEAADDDEGFSDEYLACMLTAHALVRP